MRGMSSVVETLEAEITRLKAELASDSRYRLLVRTEELLAEHRGGKSPGTGGIPEGYKLVPLSKEEKIRVEATKFLKDRHYRAHRTDIAQRLVDLGIMDPEKNPVQNLSVYFARWSEFESQGKGWYALKMTTDAKKENRAQEGDPVSDT